MKNLLILVCLIVAAVRAATAAEPDPMEARARGKADRPWFAQFMSSDPVVAAFPGESEQDRTKRVEKWKDAKFGLFLHWGPQKAGGEVKIGDNDLRRFNPT